MLLRRHIGLPGRIFLPSSPSARRAERGGGAFFSGAWKARWLVSSSTGASGLCHLPHETENVAGIQRSRWLVSRTGAGRDIRGDLSLFNFHSWFFLTVGLISVIGIEATISFHLLWAVFSSNLLQGCQTYSNLRNKK